METVTSSTVNAKGRMAGFILFALVVVTAVLIVSTAVGDGITNAANAATAHARATSIARCGLDEKTYVQASPMAQMAIEQQCSAPAEVQP